MIPIDKIGLTEGVHKDHYEFWKTKKYEFVEAFALQNPSEYKDTKAHSLAWNLDPETYAKYVKITDGQDLKLYVIFLSLTSILLRKYTGRSKQIINSPLLKGVSGMNMIDFVPQLLEVKPDTKLIELFSIVQKSIKTCYRYQGYPIDVLENHSLITNVCMSYDKIHQTSESSNLCDYHLEIERHDDRLSFCLNTRNVDVFLAQSFVESFKLLLDYCPDNFQSLVSDIEIVNDTQKDVILNEFQSVSSNCEPNSTIPEVFEKTVERNPNGKAIVTENRELTYFEFNGEVNKLARHLREKCNVGRNDVVGVMMDSSAEAMIGYMAIIKAGGTYLPIDPDYPEARKDHYLSKSKAKVLITVSNYLLDVTFFTGQLFLIDAQLSDLTESKENLQIINSTDDIAYIIFTSGSTGDPKGVLVSHGANINMGTSIVSLLSITPEDTILQFASLAFDASIAEIGMAFYSGSALAIMGQDFIGDTNLFVEKLNSFEVSMAIFPPAYLHLLPKEKINTLKTIVSAGEAANVKDAIICSEFTNFYNAYGPTEAAVWTTSKLYSRSDIEAEYIPIGTPIGGVNVFIMDVDKNVAPIGVVGEICISGDSLASGYLNEEEKSLEKFIDHPLAKESKLYQTGDLGRWLPNGDIVYIGRKDNQVKVRGYRIEPGEIESTLKKHFQISEAVVLPMKDGNGSNQLTAYVQCIDNALTTAAIRDFLKIELPDYAVPYHYVILSTFPLNINGKIDRKALAELKSKENDSNYVAPRDEIEQKLHEILVTVLSGTSDKISIDANFFDIGGDSLKSISLYKAINIAFPDVFQLSDFFSHENIQKMASKIRESEKEYGVEIGGAKKMNRVKI